MADNNTPPKPPPLPPRNQKPPPLPPNNAKPPPLPKRDRQPKRPGEPDTGRDLSHEMTDFLRNMTNINDMLGQNNKQMTDFTKAMKDLFKIVNKINKDSSTLSDNIKDAARSAGGDRGGDEGALPDFMQPAKSDSVIDQIISGHAQVQPNNSTLGDFSLTNVQKMRKALNENETAATLSGEAMKKTGIGMGSLAQSAGVSTKSLGALLTPTQMLAIGLDVLYNIAKKTYAYIDTRIIPTLRDFRKTLGDAGAATDKLAMQGVALGNEFALLGLPFEEGAALVRDFAKTLDTVELSPELITTARVLAEQFNLGADKAGELTKVFRITTGSVAGLKNAFNEAANATTTFGIPMNTIMADISDAPDLLARFGTASVAQMAKSATAARRFGLSISQVNNSFGKTLDTFEGAATATSKLNAVFGTNINAMKLMQQTDPQKRMEMLRKSLLAQGKSWDKLSVFEKNYITNTLGIDGAQAQLAFSSDKARRAYEKQQREAAKNAEVNRQWDGNMTRLKKTLMNFGEEVFQTAYAVGDFIAKFFNFKSAQDVAEKFASGVKSVFSNMRNFFKAWGDSITETHVGFSSFFRDILAYVGSGTYLLDIVKDLVKWLGNLVGLFFKMIGFTEAGNLFEKLGDGFANLAEDLEDYMADAIVNIRKDFTNMFTNMLSHLPDWVGSTLGFKPGVDFPTLPTSSSPVAPIDFSAQENLNNNPMSDPSGRPSPQVPLFEMPMPKTPNSGKSNEIINIPINIDGRKVSEVQVRRAIGAR